jgi:hypothetical protein
VGVCFVSIIALNSYEIVVGISDSLLLSATAILVSIISLVNIKLDDDATWLGCGLAMMLIASMQVAGMNP